MGEGLRFTPANEQPKPVVSEIEKGSEPEDKLSPEKASVTSPPKPTEEKDEAENTQTLGLTIQTLLNG